MKSPLQAFQFMGGTKLRYEAANGPCPGLLNPRMMDLVRCAEPVRICYRVWVVGKLD